jgi:hypothetical protein
MLLAGVLRQKFERALARQPAGVGMISVSAAGIVEAMLGSGYSVNRYARLRRRKIRCVVAACRVFAADMGDPGQLGHSSAKSGIIEP